MLDGLSIAWAVIEYLHGAINCRTLASTHYYQLAKLADSLPRVDCYHVTAKNSKEGISFTFKVLVSISVLLRFSVSCSRDTGTPLEKDDARYSKYRLTFCDMKSIFSSIINPETRNLSIYVLVSNQSSTMDNRNTFPIQSFYYPW